MLQQDDLVSPSDHLPIDDISSPISAQLFEFCDHEVFPETLQNSEVSSCSNCCCEENTSYTTNPCFSSFSSIPLDVGEHNYISNSNIDTNINNTLTTINDNSNELIPIIFDSQDENENNISASIDFSSAPTFPPFLTTQQDQFSFSSLEQQIQSSDVNNVFSSYSSDSIVPLEGTPLSSILEDHCLNPMASSYLPLDAPSSSCSFIGPTMEPYLPGNLNASLSTDASCIFGGNLFMVSELQPQELEVQGDNYGIPLSDSLQQVYNSRDIQTLNNENQQLVDGVGHSNPLATEMSTLEESTYKVGKLSVEERKEKIHRYMKKRNERNFSKKIKYACRKTLADSRPRVRGRFAKNDEFGEAMRHASSHHEDEEDEDVQVKEQEDIVDSSDIFAQISGVDPFKCNYPIQSWI